MASDEELIGRVGIGNQDALAELCRRYERPLYRFLARHTGGRDVEDLFQETWLRAVRAAPRFDPSRRFSTWVFQIAVNLCRDWHRRPPPEPVETDDNLASTSDAPEARIDARRLLAALPEAQRTVLLLRHYHGLSEEETAEILGCPRGTVKSRLHAARERLGRLMGSA